MKEFNTLLKGNLSAVLRKGHFIVFSPQFSFWSPVYLSDLRLHCPFCQSNPVLFLRHLKWSPFFIARLELHIHGLLLRTPQVSCPALDSSCLIYSIWTSCCQHYAQSFHYAAFEGTATAAALPGDLPPVGVMLNIHKTWFTATKTKHLFHSAQDAPPQILKSLFPSPVSVLLILQMTMSQEIKCIVFFFTLSP